MKKIILLILLTLTIITTLPVNSYSFNKRHPRHRVIITHRWPRHHVVIVTHRRYHRHHFRRLPPVWIPRDPWR